MACLCIYHHISCVGAVFGIPSANQGEVHDGLVGSTGAWTRVHGLLLVFCHGGGEGMKCVSYGNSMFQQKGRGEEDIE